MGKMNKTHDSVGKEARGMEAAVWEAGRRREKRASYVLAGGVLVMVAGLSQAQVKIGDDPVTINPGSLLELESTARGVLMPRVALTDSVTWTLIGNQPVDGMMVYNTTATTGVNGLQAGMAVWKNGQWISVDETPYFHVNSTVVGNSTLANSGATGIHSMAAGPNAAASGEGAFAAGYGASAVSNGSVALGSGSVSDRAIAGTQGTLPAGSNFVVPYNTTDRTLLGAMSVGNATSYRQITNVADGTEQQDAVTVRQLTGALQSFAVTPTLYFHANSTSADSAAVGVESVAIGPQTIVNGDSGIGIGNGATVQASASGGIAIGAGSSVTQAGGVALGAGSVASTGAGVVGYIPPTATTGQRAAIGATTGTLAAVSVGDAANGQFRQITGVAAGTVDGDAVNVSQLKAVQGQVTQIDQGTVKYETNADGSVNYNSVKMGGDGATGPATVHNVAEGVAGTDAVNVNQLNGATSKLNSRIDDLADRVNANTRMLSGGIAASAAMAVVTPVEPGRYHVSGAVAGYNGQAGIGVNLLKRSDNGQTTLHAGVGWGSGGSKAIVRVGFGFSFD
jgi:autotransporter adhesin